VQGKKKRDADAAEALKKRLALESGQPEEPTRIVGDMEEGPSNLLATKDEDVIF